MRSAYFLKCRIKLTCRTIVVIVCFAARCPADRVRVASTRLLLPTRAQAPSRRPSDLDLDSAQTTFTFTARRRRRRPAPPST